MKQFITIVFIIVLFSCGPEKSVLLPEIQNAKITEIKDVSPAYIFYDETKADSVELNRKNLIISTNWLVNIDKRLKLKQALPSILKLQNKKRNAKMHKNENARNYYTCNDTSIKNLGFIDFTDIIYHKESSWDYYSKISSIQTAPKIHLSVLANNTIEIITDFYDSKILKTTEKDFFKEIDDLAPNSTTLKTEIILSFNKNLSFQNYISIKSLLKEIKSKNITISPDEFIY